MTELYKFCRVDLLGSYRSPCITFFPIQKDFDGISSVPIDLPFAGSTAPHRVMTKYVHQLSIDRFSRHGLWEKSGDGSRGCTTGGTGAMVRRCRSISRSTTGPTIFFPIRGRGNGTAVLSSSVRNDQQLRAGWNLELTTGSADGDRHHQLCHRSLPSTPLRSPDRAQSGSGIAFDYAGHTCICATLCRFARRRPRVFRPRTGSKYDSGEPAGLWRIHGDTQDPGQVR